MLTSEPAQHPPAAKSIEMSGTSIIDVAVITAAVKGSPFKGRPPKLKPDAVPSKKKKISTLKKPDATAPKQAVKMGAAAAGKTTAASPKPVKALLDQMMGAPVSVATAVATAVATVVATAVATAATEEPASAAAAAAADDDEPAPDDDPATADGEATAAAADMGAAAPAGAAPATATAAAAAAAPTVPAVTQAPTLTDGLTESEQQGLLHMAKSSVTWTHSELVTYYKTYRVSGRDFHQISRNLNGSKTPYQCDTYYRNWNRRFPPMDQYLKKFVAKATAVAAKKAAPKAALASSALAKGAVTKGPSPKVRSERTPIPVPVKDTTPEAAAVKRTKSSTRLAVRRAILEDRSAKPAHKRSGSGGRKKRRGHGAGGRAVCEPYVIGAPNKPIKRFMRGMRIEAVDDTNMWYRSEVAAVNNEASEILVHFIGWPSNFDQLFDFDSPKVRAYGRLDKVAKEQALARPKIRPQPRPRGERQSSPAWTFGDMPDAELDRKSRSRKKVERLTVAHPDDELSPKAEDGEASEDSMGESEESESESESEGEELEETSPSSKAKAAAGAPKLTRAAPKSKIKSGPKPKMGKPAPKPKETKAELKAKEAKLLVKQAKAAKSAKSKPKAGKTPGATVKLAKAAALCAIAEAEKEMTEIVPYFWEKKDPGCKACTTRRHVAHTCTYRGRHPGRKARPKHMTAAASAAAAKKAAEQALAELAKSPGKAGKTMKKMAVLRAGSKSPLPGKSLKLIMRNVTAPSPKPEVQRANSTPAPGQKGGDLKRPRALSDSAIGAAESQRRKSANDALWGDGYLLDRSFAPKTIEQVVVKEILTPTFRNLKTPSPGGGVATVFDFAPMVDGVKRSVHSVGKEDLDDQVFDERHSAGEAMEKERHQGVPPIPEESEPTSPESPGSPTDPKNFVFPKQDRRSANGPGRWDNHALFKPREFAQLAL